MSLWHYSKSELLNHTYILYAAMIGTHSLIQTLYSVLESVLSDRFPG